jgi:hypothetical protein
VPIVHEKVGSERASVEIIDAARAVGNVPKDDYLALRVFAEDIGQGACKHLEALGKLQGHALCASLLDAVHRLVHLKVVVGWQQGNRLVELHVLRD